MAIPSAPTTDELRRLVDAFGQLSPASADAERVDRIRVLEELRGALAAAQAEELAAFAASQQQAAARAGVAADRQTRGIAGQLGLALRCSPWQASRRLGFAQVLCRELPGTRAALRTGRTTEWRAMMVARETAVLSLADRKRVDLELAPQLERLGDRSVAAEAKKIAYRLDPESVAARNAKAEQDRRVSIRPAPDTMCWVGALVPMAQGVGAYASLARGADLHVGVGDEDRSRSQAMADLFVERLTGRAKADEVPVEVCLVMPAESLLGENGAAGRDEPAHVDGYGPVPAATARRIALGEGRRWLRRLFTAPGSTDLAAMESRAREFTPAQRQFLRLRDQTCRTPWCDAPIRHADHVEAHAAGGPTTITNGQGLCEACNHAKQALGWSARSGLDGSVITRTPTGHEYVSEQSRAADPPTLRRSRVEWIFKHDLNLTIDPAHKPAA